jgi:hypothetical protein
MTMVRKSFILTAIGAGMITLSPVAASAAIVCSGNVCWHVREAYQYPPEARVIIHPDSWRWGPSITFREHEGRGYWRGRDWVEF